MSEWAETVDPGSGKVYFYNSRSGVSMWERPPELGGNPDRGFRRERSRSPDPRNHDSRDRDSRELDRYDREDRGGGGSKGGKEEQRDDDGGGKGGKGKGGKAPNPGDWECPNPR